MQAQQGQTEQEEEAALHHEGLATAEDPAWRAFHQANIAWNTVNLGISGLSLRKMRREVPGAGGLAAALDRERTMAIALALNAGLDGVVTRDGISFVPYLESAGPHLPLRTIDYQEYFFPSGPGPYTIDFRIARDARFKLIRDQVTGTQELYDLRVDPFETNNLLPGPLPPYIKQSYKALSAHIDGVLASE